MHSTLFDYLLIVALSGLQCVRGTYSCSLLHSCCSGTRVVGVADLCCYHIDLPVGELIWTLRLSRAVVSNYCSPVR